MNNNMTEDDNKGLIKRLEERYLEARRERAAKELADQPMKDRITSIFKSPRFTTTDFWCDTCKRDCNGTGYRQVCTVREWAPTAWFLGYCPYGHKMIRRITDKGTDPYYEKSEQLQRQRYEMKDDLLTPDDPRFKELYPKQWEELMNKKDENTTNKK
jgi:hypothetical protein